MQSFIGKVKKYATEVLTSIENDLLGYSLGVVASEPGNGGGSTGGATYIPHAFDKVLFVSVVPVSTGAVGADNGVPLFTTVKGFHVLTDADGNFVDKAIADLPAYVASTAYKVGAVITSGGKALVCITAHTSHASDGIDLTKFEELTQTKFLKVIHTPAAQDKSVFINYKVDGIKNSNG